MNDIINNHHPKFRTEGKTMETAKVFLQCSNCDVDIRELKPTESINVTRAYYCDECDSGAVVLNPPTDVH